MKKAIALIGITSVLAAASQAGAVTVTLACGTVGIELQLCKEGSARWAKRLATP